MRIARGVPALTLCAIALAGCGTSERDQVRAKVKQFVSATGKHDYSVLCKQVLAPALLSHLVNYGIPCEKALSIGDANVSEPSLAIGRIDVHGNSASVVTITTAKGQQAALDAIDLVKTSAGWRITSLSAPTFPR